MNANELADALDWVCENHLVGIGDADFKATATMLRQQEVEIERITSKHEEMLTVKELTDEEILEEWDWNSGEILATDLLDFADAILRKAQKNG